MRYGVYVPNFGPYGDARILADLAYEAEEAGWDGFFLWDAWVRSSRPCHVAARGRLRGKPCRWITCPRGG